MEEKNAYTNIDLNLVGKCFSNALMDVVSTTSGFELSEEINDREELQEVTSGIEGIMVLVGERSSIVSLSMSIDAAILLVSYMTGISSLDLKDDDLHDGVTELVNMIAGRAKILLAETPCHFMLTSPFAIVGQNRLFIHKKQVARIIKKFGSSEIDIMLKIIYLN
jgi:chemotaxis protein CheX